MTDFANLARRKTKSGFSAFYWLVHNKDIPPHVEEVWIPALYDAWKHHEPFLLEGWRGSTKSTLLATFAAWLLGHDPKGSVLIIRSNEVKAAEMAQMMADIIENQPGWKAVFPNVIPDKQRGWSAQGYEIQDVSIPYEDWRRKNSDRIDPSFAGLSYNAKAIMGWHPRTMLMIDDVLDEDNTTSARMVDEVKRRVMGTILYTRSPNDPFFVVSGVPWTADDIIASFKATGEFSCVFTPCYKEDGTEWWPEVWPKKRIEKERRLDITMGVQFARNMLLDLTAAAQRVFKYQTYPAHLINPMWGAVGGVDYASVMDPTRRNSQHSHFALAYVMKDPAGGAVIMDGVLEQCSQGEAEGHMDKAQAMFPSWSGAVVEQIGKGDDFFQMLYRKPHIRLIPMPRGTKLKSKADRLAHELGPWLENGRLRISDAETPFLSGLRRFFNLYPNVREHDPGWDAADAVYWAARGMPDVLIMPKQREDIAAPWFTEEKAANPWAALGKQHA